MTAIQVLGLAVMTGALSMYAVSLLSTMSSQFQGNRVPTAHVRMRIGVFGLVMFGAALFVLGTPLSPGFALGLSVVGCVIIAFSFAVRSS